MILSCLRPLAIMQPSLLSVLLAFIIGPLIASAAKSFAGSNLYYAAGLYPADRTTLLK